MRRLAYCEICFAVYFLLPTNRGYGRGPVPEDYHHHGCRGEDAFSWVNPPPNS